MEGVEREISISAPFAQKLGTVTEENHMEQGNILEARNITKVYPGGVVANHNVNLSVKKGEIHALVGENGAGKSTLMKMLFGMLAPTEGQIFVDGKEVHFTSSGDAIAAGLGMVHQHFMQVPSMTVAENLILGAETGSPFKVDRKKAVEITRELSERYNLKVEAEEKVEDISLAMRQKLEILKLWQNIKQSLKKADRTTVRDLKKCEN